jgi:hypothetical protein
MIERCGTGLFSLKWRRSLRSQASHFGIPLLIPRKLRLPVVQSRFWHSRQAVVLMLVQKRPCTNMTSRRRGKTRSGVPGRSARCKRNRWPLNERLAEPAAREAMSRAGKGSRELLISTGKAGLDGVSVAVRDSGSGLAPASFEHLFEAFYTTKPGGLGMGLSICRSIIEAHGGRLWATANLPQGAVFQITVPAHPDSAP